MFGTAKVVKRVINGRQQELSPEPAGDSRAAEAYERAVKSKARGRAFVAAMGVAAIVGTGYVVLEGVDKVAKGAESAKPHGDMQAQVDNVLQNVKKSKKSILIEGEGRSTAQVNVRSESNAPVVGGLYNATVAKGTDRKAVASRGGDVQVGVGRDAIKLEAYELSKEAGNGLKWGIRAKVEADKVFAQTANMRNLTKGGELQSTADNDFLSFGSDKGTAQRSGLAAELADTSLSDACGSALKATVPEGVEDMVRYQVGAGTILEDVPGHQKSADLLKRLAKGPIDVVLTGSHGQPVEPADISLPRSSPGKEAVAGMLDTSPEDITMVSGAEECRFTGTAFQDQLEILGLPDNRQGL